MICELIEVTDGFWNIRGSYKIGGLLDVGTQASLVRLSGGGFVLLDAYTFRDEVADALGELTNDGQDVKAILNLHPFHTLHVENAHERYPDAELVGSARHRERFPDLPWSAMSIEDPALHARYAADLEFTVPRGVDFISADQNVHFSSVMAYHPASRTIHSDDTLMYLRGPGVARMFGLGDSVSFHPTLAKALEPRAGAAQDFRDWARGMIDAWGEAENLCAAHTATLLGEENDGAPLKERMLAALEKVEKTLAAHERRFG